MIGSLNKRVTIQKALYSSDGGGGLASEWQSIATNPNVYAAISPLSGGEQLRFHQLENNISHRIIIRYRDDINTTMRLINGTITYDIKSIINIGERCEYLEILAIVKE